MKVFGIGLSKTGTTTLTAALDILGFQPALHSPVCHAEISQCGSATDLTVAYRFAVLMRLWPDAKFILTVRPMEAWIISSERAFVRNFANRQDNPDPHFWAIKEAVLNVFGRLAYDPDIWRQAYRKHEAAVLAAFADQPGRLLVIDVTSGKSSFSKWRTLCMFLGVPIPHEMFPHENQTAW